MVVSPGRSNRIGAQLDEVEVLAVGEPLDVHRRVEGVVGREVGLQQAAGDRQPLQLVGARESRSAGASPSDSVRPPPSTVEYRYCMGSAEPSTTSVTRGDS